MTERPGDRGIASLPPMFPGGYRIGREEEAAVRRVIRSKRLFRYGGITDGLSEVEAFERGLAATFDASHAVAVGSGTLALMCALASAGIGPGDEVLVPAYTWVSTAAAVLAVGAIPVIAEIDETLTLDADDAASRVTDRTRAIIPVHMRGAAADMDAIRRLAVRHGLRVIEDAAQAIGGRFRGRRLGTLGDLGCLSLQYNKIITCGEGGAVITDDAVLHERVLLYHDVAASQRQDVGQGSAFFGLVCRMSELQGAVARVQLSRLDDIISSCRSSRARIVRHVGDVLGAGSIRMRPCHDDAGDTGIALVLLCPDGGTAERLARDLRSSGLPARGLFAPDRPDLHVAYHWGPLLEHRSWSATTPWSHAPGDPVHQPGDWPRTTDLLGRSVHLDVSPDLSDDQLAWFGEQLREAITRL